MPQPPSYQRDEQRAVAPSAQQAPADAAETVSYGPPREHGPTASSDFEPTDPITNADSTAAATAQPPTRRSDPQAQEGWGEDAVRGSRSFYFLLDVIVILGIAIFGALLIF